MTDFFTSLTGILNGLGAWAASLDDRFGELAPVVAGAATALAVAIALAVYFRSGYRTSRDVVRHGLATLVVLGLLAFVAYDIRHTALDTPGINPSRPAVEFEVSPLKARRLTADASQWAARRTAHAHFVIA